VKPSPGRSTTHGHHAAFDDGPASPKLKRGTWERTFEQPGTYDDYICTLHPNMTGTVTAR
jgi:plastocyanin